jgi:hypothetical protein
LGSSLLSLAESKDGGGLSTGTLESDEENIAYRIRTAGDRVWAFGGTNLDFFSSRINGTDEPRHTFCQFLLFQPLIMFGLVSFSLASC